MDIEHDYQDNDEYFSDAEVDATYTESDDEYDYQNDNPYLSEITRPQIKWALIRLDTNVFEISTIGTIKPYRSLEKSTEGTNYSGTPYRYYSVQTKEGYQKNYYVHELVWRAFNGPPHENYEIKHKPEYTAKYRQLYSNSLHNLTLVKKVAISTVNFQINTFKE